MPLAAVLISRAGEGPAPRSTSQERMTLKATGCMEGHKGQAAAPGRPTGITRPYVWAAGVEGAGLHMHPLSQPTWQSQYPGAMRKLREGERAIMGPDSCSASSVAQSPPWGIESLFLPPWPPAGSPWCLWSPAFHSYWDRRPDCLLPEATLALDRNIKPHPIS